MSGCKHYVLVRYCRDNFFVSEADIRSSKNAKIWQQNPRLKALRNKLSIRIMCLILSLQLRWTDGNDLYVTMLPVYNGTGTLPVENGESVDAFRDVKQRAKYGEDTQRSPEVLGRRTDHQPVVELIGRQMDEVDQVQDDVQSPENEHNRHPGPPSPQPGLDSESHFWV